MNSNTYCTSQHAPEGAKHRSKGFRQSEPHNLLTDLDVFLSPPCKLKLQIYHRGKKVPFASPLRTLSSRCFLFHASVQSVPQSQLHRAGISQQSYQHSRKTPAPPLWRQRTYWRHKTLWLIILFYTSVFFTMMTTDPPSTSKCRAQVNRLIVFNKREVHPIFSSHGEVTPRLCNYTILITTSEFAETGQNKLFATAQKSTQAANSTQEIGQVLRQAAHIQLLLKLYIISTTLSLSLTPMCVYKQQALHCGCGHVSWFT